MRRTLIPAAVVLAGLAVIVACWAAFRDAPEEWGCASISDTPGGGSVTVVVRHEDGTPAAGAVVTLTAWSLDTAAPVTGTTDENGRTVLSMDRVGTAYAVWQDTEATIRDLSGAHTEITLSLRAAVRVAGAVLDEDGAAVGGAACALWWPYDDATGSGTGVKRGTISRADGTFEFAPMPRTGAIERCWISVKAPGFLRERIEFADIDAFDRPATVRLRPGVRVRGRCVDDTGRALAGVRVSSRREHHGTSGPDGRFEVDGVMPRDDAVLIFPEDRVPVLVHHLADRGADVDVGDVTLSSGASIHGAVVDADGARIAGADIVVEPETRPRRWGRRTSTDAAGRFEVHALPDAAFRIRAWVAARGPSGESRSGLAEGVRPGPAEVRVALPPGLHATFRLLRADHTPVAVRTVNVTIVSSDVRVEPGGRDWTSSEATLDSVVFPFETGGTFSADVTVPGFDVVRVEDFEVREGRTTVVDVLLRESPK